MCPGTGIVITCGGMQYLVKTPWWMKRLYPRRLWHVSSREKILYLTFDDGPHPEVTMLVLDELKKYQAKATFFCIGDNVAKYPEVYKRIIDEGHRTGNHTQHHKNGWKTKDDEYLNDITQASALISSSLFRPPYGRLRSSQARRIREALNNPDGKIVMWDVLSGDFDTGKDGHTCYENVVRHAGPGSIIVFHDSEKARNRLAVCLPLVLSFFAEKGYRFFHL